MKKKQMILRCAKILCVVLCFLVLSDVCVDLFKFQDYNVIKMESFYSEPKDTLDVVLLGASETFTDFSSAHAYDLYGFTGYPYALDANPGSVYESQLREIRNHQSPQKIVVEINGFLYDDPKLQTDSGCLRRYLNNIPISFNWAKTILEETAQEEWYFIFFPLFKCHERWKTVDEQLPWLQDSYKIRFGASRLKGNVSTLNCYSGPASRNVSGDMTTAPLEPLAEECLVDFLDYCKEEKIDNLLFVRFPHVIATEESYERYCRGNEAERIIREYGYDFLNLERDGQAIGLDEATDYYNEDHLNYRGQQKLTAYLGKLLVDDYGVKPSELTQKQKEDWDTAAQYSRRFYALCDEWIDTQRGRALYESTSLMEILDQR